MRDTPMEPMVDFIIGLLVLIGLAGLGLGALVLFAG